MPTRKVQRFLLKYEPVGIGLEVSDGEEMSVIHHELPTDQKTKQQLEFLVEQLIVKFSDLLTKKRHGSALMQTLARLYDVNLAEEEDKEDEEASPGAGHGSDEGGLKVGAVVVMSGLSGKLQVLNGELGHIVKAKRDKQKYEVAPGHPPNGEEDPVKVKGDEHLLLVKLDKIPLTGDVVAIRGLKNHMELNGILARVVERHEEAKRYEVRARESGQLFRVKQENLVALDDIHKYSDPAPEANASSTPRKKEGGLLPPAGDAQGGDGDGQTFEVGSTVELVGLKTAQAYNGQQAEVLSVDRVRSRYEIRLGDGSVKTIRAENVRLVQGKSPRSKRAKDKS
eukprot:gb/GFBE01001964.1/.p1 GENE.gb/GFBE01001964.1/~~gb/GFBE01001964.1/.p1  ORF type:complete len:339 (+),score=84.70 gb/GFBE01001964.1/:1-1017(+)